MPENVKHTLAPEQAVSGNEPVPGLHSVTIEKEYISSMLDGACAEDHAAAMMADVVDYSVAYKNEDIECTVFDVEGINLALPTSLIKKNISEKVDLLDHNKELETGMMLGKIKNDKEIVDIIDLEYLVMNGIEHKCYSSKNKKSVSNVILLRGCTVGIAHDGTLAIETISHNNVCWRDETSNRLWLAGTVSKMGFSLIDVTGILGMISDSYIENRGYKNG